MQKTTPTGSVRYSWDDQERLVRETDGTGAVLARYTWGGPNQPLSMRLGSVPYYPHSNARGDILAITDATGKRVASYEYGPWGELISSTGSLTQPWRSAGYYSDRETGLSYVQQRYYDPALGRFLTKEPMFSDFCVDCGFEALLDHAPVTSPYAYAQNRPLVFVDPDGRVVILPSIAAAAARVAIGAASRAGAAAARAYAKKVRINSRGRRLNQDRLRHDAAVASKVAFYRRRGFTAVANRTCFRKQAMGFCRIPDIIIYGGRDERVVRLIEVKTGRSPYHGTRQKRQDDIIRRRTGITTNLVRVP